jgi:Dyp-type peroxidase family
VLATDCKIREAPATSQLEANHKDPARQTVFPEPLLDIKAIQGSIVPGFNKSHRILLFLRVHREKGQSPVNFKRWLKDQIPFVATADEVLAFNNLFKSTRLRRKREGTVKATWMAISFAFDLLRDLNQEASQFTDAAFREGLVRRSTDLGDPAQGPFSAANWLVGGPHNQADVMMMIESDDREDMLDELLRIEESIIAANLRDGDRPDSRIEILFADEGANLPAPLSGHEHFGFLDGVSQPGLRGLLSADPSNVLTLRQNPNRRDLPEDPTKTASTTNLIQPAQGKPGQDLLYPGEFIFGYPRQIPAPDPLADGVNPHPGKNSLLKLKGEGRCAPEWAKDGSFLVFRRLRQDVGGFHSFLHQVAKAQAIQDPPNASAARLVGSKLVGRWPSGAPVERVPGEENFALGNDDCKNNNFEFQGASDPITPKPGDRSACRDDDPSPAQAEGDADGSRCPFSAHIRKAYPRDDEALKVGPPSDPHLGEAATQTHRLLRRGLPYGPISVSSPDAPVDDEVDRGLQFLAYQTSIENQFEFVIKNWVNAPDFKEPVNSSPDGSPIHQGGGYDPILGQNGNAGEHRARQFTLTIPDPEASAGSRKVKAVQLTTDKDWVMPTGGGYFFTPSIRALKENLT